MKNENLVPKVRFKGFSDPWEQRKLSSVVTLVKSYSITRDNERKSTNTEYIHYGDIHKFTNTIIDDHVTLPNIADGDYIPLNEGDLVLADASEDYVEIAKPLVLFKTDGRNIVSGLHTIALHPHDVESLFLYNVFNSQNFRRYGYKVGTGLKVFGVSSKNILKYSFNSPSMYEQKKIDSILLKLTDLIAANEDKLEQLKTLKKLMMQKIFSQEWRFKGFTDPWEQRKFSKLLDVSDGVRRGPFGSALKKSYFVKDSPYVVYEQQNAIYNRYSTRYHITQEKYDELSKFKLLPGDFIMSGAGTIGRISEVPLGIQKGVFNQALIRFRINPAIVDRRYFLMFMRGEIMQRHLTEANPGSAITNLVPMKDVKNYIVSISNLAEQKKIGKIIENVDSLIAANEDKLNQLKKLKKYLMQNMFV